MDNTANNKRRQIGFVELFSFIAEHWFKKVQKYFCRCEYSGL
jgi:hypothetical protein